MKAITGAPDSFRFTHPSACLLSARYTRSLVALLASLSSSHPEATMFVFISPTNQFAG